MLDPIPLCEMKELVFLIPDHEATVPQCDLNELESEFRASGLVLSKDQTQFERVP